MTSDTVNEASPRERIVTDSKRRQWRDASRRYRERKMEINPMNNIIQSTRFAFVWKNRGRQARYRASLTVDQRAAALDNKREYAKTKRQNETRNERFWRLLYRRHTRSSHLDDTALLVDEHRRSSADFHKSSFDNVADIKESGHTVEEDVKIALKEFYNIRDIAIKGHIVDKNKLTFFRQHLIEMPSDFFEEYIKFM